MRHNIIHNAAISAAKLQNYCRIAKGIDKITQILRRFFSQNAESWQGTGICHPQNISLI
jgi:hypothetical protein